MSATTFHDNSKQVVKDFINTVIFIDDRAYFDDELQKAEIPVKIDLNLVKEAKMNKEIEPSASNIEMIKPLSILKSFNVSEVSKWFSENGIICSVLKPKESDNIKIDYLPVLKRADVTIIDWELFDKGENANEIIKSIIEDDKKHSPSLRLILIYTSVDALNEISETIQKTIISVGIESDSIKKECNDCTFIFGHTIISVYRKEYGNEHYAYKDRVKKYNQLPETIFNDFIKLTSGLVSNAVLKSITVLRANTHKLLSIFNKDLDPSFLSHRILLPNPDDSKEYIVDIISDAINSLLHYNSIGEQVSFETIRNWIESQNLPDIKKTLFKENSSINNTVRLDLLKNGFSIKSTEIGKILSKRHPDEQEKWENKLRNSSKEFHKQATELFIQNGVEYSDIDYQFSILTHHKSNLGIGGYTPKLTLGSIIKGSRTGHWMCIQQKCDSTRIEVPRRFMFLFLKPITDEGTFNIIIEDLGFKKFLIQDDTYELRTIKFPPAPNKDIVEAVLRDKKFYFVPFYNSDNKDYKMEIDEEFEWILDLKEAHAQRIVNKFAAQLSRVGLDESEWLRRGAIK